MKKLIIAVVWVLAATSTVIAANPHANPPGNDGPNCHGANKASCRPDPQPSHGQDCQPHGNNPDGNDDHCGPSSAPTNTPSNEPSETPHGSEPPAVEHFPNLTPPPTDTE